MEKFLFFSKKERIAQMVVAQFSRVVWDEMGELEETQRAPAFGHGA
jgi:dUTPase